MTLQEWLTSADPEKLLISVRVGASDRKLRLFACACCRQAWNVFVAPFTIQVVTAAEAFAEGEISAAALARVQAAALRAQATADRETPDYRSTYPAHTASAAANATHPAAGTAAIYASRFAALAVAGAPTTGYLRNGKVDTDYLPQEYRDEITTQADLLRDIFGNPFGSVEFQLEWFTSDVVALARGIYADRAFDRMPILADALQDAGCDDDDILNHCREAREHVRGCWVVDLLLGKK